jgi:hypothetical protein
MEYDWEGVEVRNYKYCCQACADGEECTCPQHNHQYGGASQLNSAAAAQLGGTEPQT